MVAVLDQGGGRIGGHDFLAQAGVQNAGLDGHQHVRVNPYWNARFYITETAFHLTAG